MVAGVRDINMPVGALGDAHRRIERSSRATPVRKALIASGQSGRSLGFGKNGLCVDVSHAPRELKHFFRCYLVLDVNQAPRENSHAHTHTPEV